MTDGASQGLFVVVAIVIFGIFVLISYMLFRDNLKPSLSSIFTDSLIQAEKNLNGENDDSNISGGNENTVSTVLLREAYDTHSAIYAKVRNNETGGVTIIGVSKTEDGEYIKDNNYSSKLGLTGEISFDKKINGKNITEIEDGVFQYSTFTGNFNAPNVTTIGSDAFSYSTFTGAFNAPNVTSIDRWAFSESTFIGEFNAPNVTNIGMSAFSNSTFTGTFNAPNVTTIGMHAFANSTFTGDFNAPNVTSIEYNVFYMSNFTGDFNAPNVTSIDNDSFCFSTFTGKFNAPNVTRIDFKAFKNSQFTSAYAPKLETIESNNGTLNTLLKK